MAIPTEYEGTRERETGERRERSRRRGVSTLLRKHISLAMLSAGSTLGLRAPGCAKEPLALWTLFIWVAAMCALRGEGLWGQRRLAKLQFMVWQVVRPHDRSYSCKLLSQAASSGSGHCPPPQTAPKSHWLSGLSSFDSPQSTSLPNMTIIAIFEQRTHASQHWASQMCPDRTS